MTPYKGIEYTLHRYTLLPTAAEKIEMVLRVDSALRGHVFRFQFLYFFSTMVNLKIWIETTTQSFFQFSFYSNQILKRVISLDFFELIFLWFLPWYSSPLVSGFLYFSEHGI